MKNRLAFDCEEYAYLLEKELTFIANLPTSKEIERGTIPNSFWIDDERILRVRELLKGK